MDEFIYEMSENVDYKFLELKVTSFLNDLFCPTAPNIYKMMSFKNIVHRKYNNFLLSFLYDS